MSRLPAEVKLLAPIYPQFFQPRARPRMGSRPWTSENIPRCRSAKARRLLLCCQYRCPQFFLHSIRSLPGARLLREEPALAYGTTALPPECRPSRSESSNISSSTVEDRDRRPDRSDESSQRDQAHRELRLQRSGSSA